MIAHLLLAATLTIATPVSDPPADPSPDPEHITMMIAALATYRHLCRDTTPLHPVTMMMLRMVLNGIDPIAVAEGDREAPEMLARIREGGEAEIKDFCDRMEPTIEEMGRSPFAPSR